MAINHDEADAAERFSFTQMHGTTPMSSSSSMNRKGQKEGGDQGMTTPSVSNEAAPGAATMPRMMMGDADDSHLPSNHNNNNKCKKFFMDPTVWIVLAALLGVGLGILMSDGRASDEVVSWVALPGDLFLRALKCLVLPLVFVNILIAVVDMMNVGKAVVIGTRTVLTYMGTTMVAALEGLIVVLLMKTFFTEQPIGTGGVEASLEFSFQCNGGNDTTDDYSSMVYATSPDGTLQCLNPASMNDSFSSTSNIFLATDLNGVLMMQGASGGGVADDISISQTVQDGLFRKMVPSNIFKDLVNANFVGVIMFAILLAVASQKMPKHRHLSDGRKVPHTNLLLDFAHELNGMFIMMLSWVIALTPLAVLSLVAGALGENSDLSSVFADIGVLVLTTLIAFAIHYFVFLPSLFFFYVRQNPFRYMAKLVPAQTFAFASASSVATLPVTTKVVSECPEIPSSVRNFTLALGATINMDGGAIYFPVSIVFLAVSSGLSDKLNVASYALMVLLSTLGAVGTAPVPSASLVLIITAFNTVFSTTGTPTTFSYILAVDWLMDRMRTTLNVSGDAIVCRVITAMCHMEVSEEMQQQQRLSGSFIKDEEATEDTVQALEERLSHTRTML